MKTIKSTAMATSVLGLILALAVSAQGEGFALKEIIEGKPGKEPIAIPRSAVTIYTYEGQPLSVHVTDKWIGVDYWYSGVTFDRASGQVAERYTVIDGWPQKRTEAFAPQRQRWSEDPMVGPGVMDARRNYGGQRPEFEVAASIDFGGNKWQALQPAEFLNTVKRPPAPGSEEGLWTGILNQLNKSSHVVSKLADGSQTRKFTMSEGLASNIVTHFAVADSTLWAACVDIYDPEKKEWGPGGLCRYDAEKQRWERIDKIDGRPVRWVTLLQSVGDELWIGFREGTGVAGDSVYFGMGLYPGHYRPKTSAIVLARLANGKWSSFSRAPLTEPLKRTPWEQERQEPDPSTEVPRMMTRSGDQVLLFSTMRAREPGNWHVEFNGHVSALDLRSGQWRRFELEKDFGADQLMRMVTEGGEIIVTSNLGAHRWDAAAGVWRFLDPKCGLHNPNISAAVPVGDELWVGYTNQDFGVLGQQGIARFDGKTGARSHFSTEELKTAAPVRRIVPMPNGDVWVYFAPRPYGGSAAEYPFYPRETKQPRQNGLARFSGGAWEFPAKLDGVPKTITGEWKGPNGVEKWEREALVQEVVGIDDKLFVQHEAGIFVGPNEWKRIVEGPIAYMAATPDAKELLIGTGNQYNYQSPKSSGRYNIATGKLTLKEKQDERDMPRRERVPSETHVPPEDMGDRWIGRCYRLGKIGNREWAIEAPEGFCFAVQTPSAIWFATMGNLVRVDRKQVEELIRNQRE